MKMETTKQKRAVVHLEMGGKHYYYGNLKALCDSWDKEEIGVAYNYLKNYGIDDEIALRDAQRWLDKLDECGLLDDVH